MYYLILIIGITFAIVDIKDGITSLPPDALVRITADETGGGMQLTTINLL